MTTYDRWAITKEGIEALRVAFPEILSVLEERNRFEKALLEQNRTGGTYV